jgi:acyl-coenzyme A thioesterase PaaI-like protein
MCGNKNPLSLRLSFRAGKKGAVWARFQARRLFQGYEGILHGGVICALLDAAMTHCLFHGGVRAVTGDLRVRFSRPVPCRAVLHLRAWPLSMRPPLYRVAAALLQGRRAMARAEARFMLYPRGGQRRRS